MGKELVQELELQSGVDTLSKWMAHYISEQIVIAENATGEEEIKAKEKCFDTILKLWERRGHLPNGSRPFEDFEQIFHVLKKIDPKGDPRPFHQLKDFDKVKEEELDSEVKYWINKVELINSYTRKLLRFCLAKAYEKSKNGSVNVWLENSIDSVPGYDIKSLDRLKNFYEEEDDSKTILDEFDKFLEGVEDIRNKIKIQDTES
ncbi:hypothetical protein [Fodinibius salsisoli]|uniref:Uncharacterized protein n=1 Tax=Fodinibius salsisoli TaxID=2820877 RepID=A0ABT3PK14_9BACT|nr:hypothetical protein [Fodinibius salsisoli]MCW9706276.1 hypothetical protein [Fodinibius salsisoli]